MLREWIRFWASLHYHLIVEMTKLESNTIGIFWAEPIALVAKEEKIQTETVIERLAAARAHLFDLQMSANAEEWHLFWKKFTESVEGIHRPLQVLGVTQADLLAMWHSLRATL